MKKFNDYERALIDLKFYLSVGSTDDIMKSIDYISSMVKDWNMLKLIGHSELIQFEKFVNDFHSYIEVVKQRPENVNQLITLKLESCYNEMHKQFVINEIIRVVTYYEECGDIIFSRIVYCVNHNMMTIRYGTLGVGISNYKTIADSYLYINFLTDLHAYGFNVFEDNFESKTFKILDKDIVLEVDRIIKKRKENPIVNLGGI